MSDIVERLRAWHTPGETITGDVQLYLDAADEIERLRAANDSDQRLLERLDTLQVALEMIASISSDERARRIACAALTPSPP